MGVCSSSHAAPFSTVCGQFAALFSTELTDTKTMADSLVRRGRLRQKGSVPFDELYAREYKTIHEALAWCRSVQSGDAEMSSASRDGAASPSPQQASHGHLPPTPQDSQAPRPQDQTAPLPAALAPDASRPVLRGSSSPGMQCAPANDAPCCAKSG